MASFTQTLRACAVAACAAVAFGAQAQMPAAGNNPAAPDQPGSGVVSRPNETSVTGTDRAVRAERRARERNMPAAGERNPGMKRSYRSPHAGKRPVRRAASGEQMPGRGGRPDQSPQNTTN